MAKKRAAAKKSTKKMTVDTKAGQRAARASKKAPSKVARFENTQEKPNAANGIPDQGSRMFFRLTYLARGVYFEFKGDEFNFQFDEPFRIDVSLQPPGSDFPDVTRNGDAVCRLDIEREPVAIVRSMFERLSRGQLPDDYGLVHPPGVLNAKGEPLKLLPQVVYMPKPFRDLVDVILPPMNEAARRILDVLRWRFDRHGASFRPSLNGYQFSFDKRTWHDMPSLVDPTMARQIDSFTHAAFSESEALALRTELQLGSAEPLAHVLFREAWGLRERSPRSSLLIGFTAAEAGVKRHIVRMMPVTKNLVMPMPSPPIKKLLDYIDDVPIAAPRIGEGKLIPRSIRTSLHEMSELRNKITHTGEHGTDGRTLTMDVLDETLGAVRDLLWLLDYYAGHQWAAHHVGRERLKELSRSRK